MEKQTIFTFKATDGMLIAEDIINNSGKMVVTKNSRLSPKIREILNANAIIEIPIFIEDNKHDIDESSNAISKDNNFTDFDSLMSSNQSSSTEIPLSQKIRQSEDYKAYVKRFSAGLKDFKLIVNDIVYKNTSIQKDDMLSITDNILNGGNSSYHILDMINNLNAYDDSTYAHSINVALICSVIADWLHYSEDDKNSLILAGLIHDIGKMKIPDKIIKKPSRLTDDEFKIIKMHPRLGYEIIKDRISDPRIKAAVLMHHEKCDGSGYPNGITSRYIPEFVKIVTIADVYDAMTSNRVYRGALCPFEVIRLFEKEGFEKYDTRCILTFLSNVVQSYQNNTVELSDGRVGKIVLINQHAISNPTVVVDNEYIDLSKCPDLHIVNIL